MEQTFRRFTCDRCKTVVEVPNGKQPTSWAGFSITYPPLGEFTVRNHLCADCSEQILDFISGRSLFYDIGRMV